MKELVRVLACSLAVLFICSSAMARLGETETESRERYGEPLKNAFKSPRPMVPGAVEKSYDFEGWRITSAYHRGTTVAIQYLKIIKPGPNPYIQNDEMMAVLTAEAGKGQWKPAGTFNPAQKLSRMVTDTTKWKNSNGRTASRTDLAINLELPEAEAIRKAAKEQTDKVRKESIPKF